MTSGSSERMPSVEERSFRRSRLDAASTRNLLAANASSAKLQQLDEHSNPTIDRFGPRSVPPDETIVDLLRGVLTFYLSLPVRFRL